MGKTKRYICRGLCITSVACVLTSVMAAAEITVYTDRATFSGAVGATRQIDFSTNDNGTPITNPSADVGFAYLGLSGMCFQNVNSYWNNLIYTFPNATITAGLPQGTYAAGTQWFPWYAAAHLFSVNVSVGGVIHQFPQLDAAVAWQSGFIGVNSDQPIDWISFSLDNAYLGLDNFTINASAGAGRGCPAPADMVGPISANVVLTPNPVPVNTPVTVSAVIDDSETGGSAVTGAQYSLSSGDFTAMSGNFGRSSLVDATAVLPGIATAGVYNVCVKGTDAAGNVGEMACAPLPVYDPSAGFVTGGGWIVSPPGAYTADASLTGKASFGFVSKYQVGASAPTGQTEFVFHTAHMNFESTSYDWLVVAGARAQYKGSGSINGEPGYTFLLTAVDGDLRGGGSPDLLRVKIWNSTGVVYDNQAGADDTAELTTAVARGAIVIHRN